jgi:hypothetical protein
MVAKILMLLEDNTRKVQNSWDSNMMDGIKGCTSERAQVPWASPDL